MEGSQLDRTSAGVDEAANIPLPVDPTQEAGMKTGGPVVRMAREWWDVTAEARRPCVHRIICLSGFLPALQHEAQVTAGDLGRLDTLLAVCSPSSL